MSFEFLAYQLKCAFILHKSQYVSTSISCLTIDVFFLCVRFCGSKVKNLQRPCQTYILVGMTTPLSLHVHPNLDLIHAITRGYLLMYGTFQAGTIIIQLLQNVFEPLKICKEHITSDLEGNEALECIILSYISQTRIHKCRLPKMCYWSSSLN